MKNLKDFDVYDLMSIMKDQSFKVFSGDKKPYNLNIVGVRSKDLRPNIFNDMMFLFWKYRGEWVLHKYPMTTDAGLYYLLNPLVHSGTAIMKMGQNIGAYKLCGQGYGCKGHGKSEYTALRQVKPIEFYRDNNRNSRFDFDESSVEKKVISANIHRANKWAIAQLVDRYSAGCQVIQNPSDYNEFIGFCKASLVHYPNEFTYTLIDLNKLS